MTRLIAFTSYIGSILLANILTTRYGLVPIGFGLMVTTGTFAAGLALILRDWVQETSHRVTVLLAILTGAALSYLLAGNTIAIASGVAFLTSELLDWAVYTGWRNKSKPGAVLASSVIAAPFDTILFLAIAGFPVTLQAVTGQFIIKTVMALTVATALATRPDDAVPDRV